MSLFGIETVWVLESSYQCTRGGIAHFLETLTHTPVFAVAEPSVLRAAVSQYKPESRIKRTL
jgi:predicted nucleic-acid-binding protein